MCWANPQPTPQIAATTQPTHANSNSHPLARNDHPIQALHHEPPSRPQSPPQPTPTLHSPYAPAPTTDPTLPWHTPITPIPTAFSISHSPWVDMDAFVLTPEGCLPETLTTFTTAHTPRENPPPKTEKPSCTGNNSYNGRGRPK